jgi:hypothetical protein
MGEAARAVSKIIERDERTVRQGRKRRRQWQFPGCVSRSRLQYRTAQLPKKEARRRIFNDIAFSSLPVARNSRYLPGERKSTSRQ